MLVLALVALAVHLAAAAALAPGVALAANALPWIAAAQFPFMGVTAAVYGVAKDRENETLAGWAFTAFGLGITVPVLVLLARFDIAIGPADPYGAPAAASAMVEVLWFAGFAAIAAIGHTMFIGRPIVQIARTVLLPLRKRAPHPAIAVATLTAAGLGVGFALFLDSSVGSELMTSLQRQTEANPAPVIIAGAIIAVCLEGAKRVARPRNRQ